MINPRVVISLPRSVLFVSPVAELGGAERVLLDVIASILATNLGIAVHVLSFADGPFIGAAERLGATTSVLQLPARLEALGDSAMVNGNRWARGVRLIGALARSTAAVLQFGLALRREIILRSPDIIHTNGVKAHLLVSLAAPRRIPLVWHVHDFLTERPIASKLLRVAAHRLDAAIAISDPVAQDLRRLLPSSHLVTIVNTVDVREFSPGPGDGRRLDTLAMMPDAPDRVLRIGLVATYARWKGHIVFLKAAALVRSLNEGRELRFYIVGGPLYATGESQITREELLKAIADLGLADAVGLIPFQTELTSILRGLDVVVHASTRREPFGRSIIEAMACGRPVITAASGGAQGLVVERVTGLTHLPGDFHELAGKIQALVESSGLREELGTNARQMVVNHFSRDGLGTLLLEAYRSLMMREGSHKGEGTPGKRSGPS